MHGSRALGLKGSNSMTDDFTAYSPESALRAGWQARESGQSKAASDLFLRSLELAEQAGDQKAIGNAKLALADNVMHCCPGNEPDPFECRERLCEEVLLVFQSIGDDAGVVDALILQASVTSKNEPVQLLEESVAIARRIEYVPGIVHGLAALGSQLLLKSDCVAGLAHKREAVQRARKHGEKRLLAFALNSLTVGLEAGHEETRVVFEELIALRKELNQPHALADDLVMSALACPADDLDGRANRLNEALAIYRELDLPARQASCLTLLAKNARDSGDAVSAEQLDRESSELNKPIQSPPGFEEALARGDVNSAKSTIRHWFSSAWRR